jgi:hypothetical protein
MVEVASTKPAPPWLTDFCADYAPTMLSLAQLFIWTGLLFALVSAMAEALLTIRQSKGGITPAGEPPSGPAVILAALKDLLLALAGVKAWLALVILGVLLLWMAGNAVPNFCATTAATPSSKQVPGPAQPGLLASHRVGSLARAPFANWEGDWRDTQGPALAPTIRL